jgi:hypothetical protein
MKGVWDGKEGRLIEMMDCLSTMNSEQASMRSDFDVDSSVLEDNNTSTSSPWKWEKRSHLWISSMDVDSGGNWAAICGGADGGSTIRQKNDNSNASSSAAIPDANAKGFVTLWNVPTRSLISACATRDYIQAVSFHDAFDRIVTVGNEPIVSFWSRSPTVPVSRQERAWLSSPSGFTLSVNPDNGVLAAGGASNGMDCYTDVGNKAFSMCVE